MKKLLVIIVLGLLWSESAFAKQILIKCIGKYTDNFVIDLNSKTWNNANAKKSLARKVYIDDQFIIETIYMESKMPCTSDGCRIGIDRLNRLTGRYTSIYLTIPKEELHKEWFDAKPMFESEKKFIDRARDYIGKKSLNPKYHHSFYEAQCSLDEKKF